MSLELRGKRSRDDASRWSETGDVEYTFDNYRPPVFVDGRLYLFYEGLTSFDAQTAKRGCASVIA